MSFQRQLLKSILFFGTLSALLGCDESVSSHPLPANEEVLNKKQHENNRIKDAERVATTEKAITQAEPEPPAEQSFLLVVRVPEPQIDKSFLRERLSNPQDRLKPKPKSPTSKKNDAPKIFLPDNEKILTDLVEKLEIETGHTPVILKAASTLVMDLTQDELEEIETWDEIQEILPNYKIER